ncbi:hypothetical protein [Allokutzneria oryzae]|uniref:Uncharacterized protein n=1 Tax=Allokutzneria oryzae TaxID=1378989 RepID=A0ABV5ZVG9_9PSEU
MAAPTGTCRTPAIYAERATATVRPCIEMAGNEPRTCRVTSSTAAQSALHGPFVVSPCAWEDAKVTGVQSPSLRWRTHAPH